MEPIPGLPCRSDVIWTHRQQGGQTAAVLPIHYPRALLHAFDILPVEVWGPPGIDGSPGAQHLQPYVCSVARNALAFVLSGGLDMVDLLIVPHACDSLQGLGSLLIDFLPPRQPVLPLYLPRAKRESDADFLAAELRALYQRLAELTGRRPSDEELLACVRQDETADEHLAELHRRRAELPLTGRDFYRLARSREYLPGARFTELALAALAGNQSLTSQPGTPVIFSGIVPEPMSVLDTLAELGGRVAADDLACCGRRLYPPGRSADPFRRMAQRMVGAPPDPTLGAPIADRLAHLQRLVSTSGARGVVFYQVKFCEPELFDLPNLRRGLQEAGIPSVAVEVDIGEGGGVSQQVATRLAAFLEMIA